MKVAKVSFYSDLPNKKHLLVGGSRTVIVLVTPRLNVMSDRLLD
ncbi:hypothetical protein [Nostoc sp.]